MKDQEADSTDPGRVSINYRSMLVTWLGLVISEFSKTRLDVYSVICCHSSDNLIILIKDSVRFDPNLLFC